MLVQKDVLGLFMCNGVWVRWIKEIVNFDGDKKYIYIYIYTIHLNAFNFGRGCHFLVFGKPLLNSSSDPLFDN